ncbi:HsdM family class I SAM-dependent methyltransferase [Winogradskyella sediminis]|uniref:HsdM family class I SAM-dependent methyltransferase n=1 Tax=Winogradskyella sediminis TaxID=1382466 RepID=UPI003AA8393D
MGKLSDINYWKKDLGLLPISLNPNNKDNRFLMLNGGNGDFCLQTSAEKTSKELFFEYSWSTNTKNYIQFDKQNAFLYNWLTNKVEEIPTKSIESNLNKFYQYITSKSYRTQNDVVPFILDVFKQLRNVTLEKSNPSEAINILFQLLISIDDEGDIDFEKWGIASIDRPDNFDYFVDLIKNGVKSIKPNLDLILRHSSGPLFQEAHREVIYFNPQRDLFGGVASELSFKNESYSSIHYTPQFLARSIVENCIAELDLKKKNLKIFDPSCGSSEFLIETLKQLRNLEYKGSIEICGWDTSPSAISTSRFLLNYENRTQWDNKLKINIRHVEDSLRIEWDSDFDLILMNPPFMSWQLLKDKESRDAVLDVLGKSFKTGRPNQASAFFYRASKSLNEAGILGCVLPSSILTFGAYNRVRNEIKERLSLKVVAKLGNYVFEDALTNVSFLIGKRPQSNSIPKLIWTKNEKGVVQKALRDFRKINANSEYSLSDKNHSIYVPIKFPLINESWKIISLDQNDFVKSLSRYVKDGNLSLISDIFNVNQGALLGKKNIFKISKEFYNEMPPNEQVFFRPVITNKSIKAGFLKIYEYVWFPYNDEIGLMIKTEAELEDLEFGRNKLIPNKIALEKRSGIKEWWNLTRPRKWQYEKRPRLYSNRFGNSNSFAIDKIGNSVIEEGNAFIPKKSFDTDDYYFYLSCFTSNIFDDFLSIFSKEILSGYDLGKIQINNIPIPNVHRAKVYNSEAYFKLVELGKELSEGNSFVKDVIDDVLTTFFYPRI